MPSVPRQDICSDLGCTNPRSLKNSLCLAHGGKDEIVWKYNPKYNQTEDRREANKMYNTRQWHSKRAAQLSTHPLCASCLASGIVTQAAHIDHVFPWSTIGKAAFYRNLFQSLCHSCHTKKTGLEQRGICRLYGSPTIDHKPTDWQFVMAVAGISA